MNILQLFKKKPKQSKSYVIEEIRPNVVEKMTEKQEIPKFLDIDVVQPHKPAVQPKTYTSPASRDWAIPTPPPTKYDMVKKPKKAPSKNGIPVKINMLPVIQDPDLEFIGLSKIDGFPCYNYIGDDPRGLARMYPLEELFNAEEMMKKQK